MSRLLTISLFIKACQKRRSFVLWRGAQSTVSGSSFSCHEFMGLGSVLYLLYFLSAGAQQCSARHLAGYASVVMRAGFKHPHSSCCPLEFEHRHVLPLRRCTSGSGQLFIFGSPQLTGVLRPTIAVLDITILLSEETLTGWKLNKATHFSGISVRYFNLEQVKTQEPRQDT